MAQERIVTRSQEFTPVGLLLRLLFALAVVAVTYNPTGFSYFDWAREALQTRSLGPLHALAGIALLGCWGLLLSATSRSLGVFGILLVGAFFAALVWLLVDRQLVDTGSFQTIAWIGVAGVAVVLGTGMSWSHIRKRVTGQADVDEVDAN